MDARISVVINTLNEERNLPFALASVRPWADEIVVVDMHSDDRTVEIARAHGANVFLHERREFVEPARAYAVAQATGDWILVLDADELVPEPLSRTLRAIARDDAADVVVLPRLNHLLGAPMRYTGWGPHQDRHPRFFRRGHFRPTDLIHGSPPPQEGARVLHLAYEPGHAIVHFNYVDTAHFLDKLNRYTSIEARQAAERGERAAGPRTLARAARVFLRRYVRQQGYRDGWRGLYLSLLMALYRVATDAKLKEIESVGTREAILDAYRSEARRILDGYAAS
ncbi:MAG TPA: glycosyltransferase family 2 protein [Longimicrobiales bacterium]